MDQIIYNEILPPLIFFFIFSIAFSLLELIVIFLLNRLGQKHWEFMIDVVIRSKVHHGKLIKCIILIFLGILAAIVVIYTPLIEILAMASKELKFFALLLALLMFLIYSINIRKTVRLDIVKKIYKTIFLVISLIFYISILVMANESYGSYVEYVNRQFIRPAVKGVETVIEEREETRLLNKFRQSYMDGKCRDADYREMDEKKTGVKNFVLIASEPELAFGDSEIDPENPKANLKGKECSDGENTFLLTEHGNWYWVIEEELDITKIQN